MKPKLTGDQLCCVLNPYILCQACGRSYCYEDWFNLIKNFPDHELVRSTLYSSYFACGDKRVNNRTHLTPPYLLEIQKSND